MSPHADSSDASSVFTKPFDRSPSLPDWGIAALGLFTFVWPFLLWGVPERFFENGPVEIPQSVYLLIASVIFLAKTRRPAPLTRLELSGIALFCFTFFIRETEVRGTALEPTLGGLFAHARALWFLAGIWVSVVGLTMPAFWPTVRDLLRWLRTPAGIAMVLGGVFYVVGEWAEHHGFYPDGDRSEALEESLELYGCFSIFLSSYLTATVLKRGAPRGAGAASGIGSR